MKLNSAKIAFVCLAVLLTGVVHSATPRVGRPAWNKPMRTGGDKTQKSDPILNSFILFTAVVDSVTPGSVAQSYPPIYNHTLKLSVKEVFRGDLKSGKTITANHQVRQHKEPKFPQGKLSVVTASKVRGRLRIDSIEEATDQLIKKARLVKSMPVGWTFKGREMLKVSPWASMGKGFWPIDSKLNKDMDVCSVTGRPLLLAGNEIQFKVMPVPPVEKIKWSNPDGDGLYEITVTNPTKKSLTVNALLKDGDKILWNESIAMVCDKATPKIQHAPGCKPVPKKVDCVTLKPGQSVTGIINAFGLKNVKWPRGGYRIEFTFALGEKSVKHSFYYRSKHHDKIKDKAKVEFQGKCCGSH